MNIETIDDILHEMRTYGEDDYMDGQDILTIYAGHPNIAG